MPRSTTTAILSLACLLAASPVSASGAGWLDRSYGTNGTTVLGAAACGVQGRPCGTAAEPTAFLTLSGTRTWTLVAGDGRVLLIARTEDGQPDSGVNRGRPVPIWSSPGSWPIGLLPRTGGGALALISRGSDIDRMAALVVVAVRSDGRPDPAFSADGQAGLWVARGAKGSTGAVQNGRSRDAVRLPSGAVRVCAEMAVEDGAGGSRQEVWLGGLTPSGEVDPAVGSDGWRVLPGIETCDSMVLDQQMRVIITGTGRQPSNRPFVRVSAWSAFDGLPDADFGGGSGSIIFFSGSRSFKAEAQRTVYGGDGRLYIGMATRDHAPGAQWIGAVARVDSEGTLEPAFGFGGIYRYGPTGSSRLTSIDVSGSSLLMGLAYAGGGRRLYLARASAATARLDPSFGRNGLVELGARVQDVVVDDSRRILDVAQFDGSSGEAPVILQRRGG